MKTKLLISVLAILLVSSVQGFTDIIGVTNISAGQHTNFGLSGIALCYEAGDLVYCGYNSDNSTHLYVFDPATESWNTVASSFATSIYYENQLVKSMTEIPMFIVHQRTGREIRVSVC